MASFYDNRDFTMQWCNITEGLANPGHSKGEHSYGGMMGISYDQMSKGMQTVAKMLPMTYISRDFVTVWTGKNYNFMPMIQSYLFLAAIAGILLFIVWKKTERKVH